MGKLRPISIISISLLLYACTVPGDITSGMASIRVGNSYQSVIQTLGTSYSSSGQAEEWKYLTYCSYGWIADDTVNLFFKDDSLYSIDKYANDPYGRNDCGWRGAVQIYRTAMNSYPSYRSPPPIPVPVPVPTVSNSIPRSATNMQTAELLLFGGTGHDVFLGCVLCSDYDTNSICNQYGAFGGPYSNNGIFNSYSNFGNSYSASSPWNQYSTSNSVPVLVDREGNFYGYFTINEFRSDANNMATEIKSNYEDVNGDLEIMQNLLCDD